MAIVCADAAALTAWWPRLVTLDPEPDVRLALAANLVAGQPAWQDAHGRQAGLKLAPCRWLVAIRRLAVDGGWPAGDATAPAPGRQARRAEGLAERRLALSSSALTTLRVIALAPLAGRTQVVRLRGTDDRQARRWLAALRAERLLDERAGGLFVTQAGLALLAGAAGLPTAVYRRLTTTAGGRLPTAGGHRAAGRSACWPGMRATPAV